MNAPSLPPDGWIEPRQLQTLLCAVHAQVAAALWLSAGMALAVAAIACAAWHLRLPALVFGLGYCASLCFVPNAHAQILGPLGCGAVIAGLLRPRRRPAAAQPGPP